MPSEARARAHAGPISLAITTALLVGLLAWSALHSDLPQFDGKAMAGRLICFPLIVLVMPIGWRIASRRQGRRLAFPWLAAVLITAPFVIDLAGNAARLYIRIEHFDDLVHAVNPVLFVAAMAMLLSQAAIPGWAAWTMAFGLGCAGHIVWEIIEYVLLVEIGAVELNLTLRDTLSDQAWGLLGAAVGAAIPLMRRRTG